jgi:hypothetical protein
MDQGGAGSLVLVVFVPLVAVLVLVLCLLFAVVVLVVAAVGGVGGGVVVVVVVVVFLAPAGEFLDEFSFDKFARRCSCLSYICRSSHVHLTGCGVSQGHLEGVETLQHSEVHKHSQDIGRRFVSDCLGILPFCVSCGWECWELPRHGGSALRIAPEDLPLQEFYIPKDRLN